MSAAWVGLGLLAWGALAVAAGVVIGQAIRRADEAGECCPCCHDEATVDDLSDAVIDMEFSQIAARAERTWWA